MINELGTEGEPDRIPIEFGDIDKMVQAIDTLLDSPLGRLFDLDLVVFVEKTQRAILDEIPEKRSQEILREQMIGEARNANNVRLWFSEAKKALLEYKQQKETET